MKLCKDCKWCRDGWRCESPQNMTGIDPVTGDKRPAWIVTCDHQRTGPLTGWIGCRLHGLCGKEGRWHEPNTQGLPRGGPETPK